MAKRKELHRTGVYFLVGPDPKNIEQERVYVGEGDNVFDRLSAHNNDNKKDFWVTTIAVTSKDENLTKAHVRYLEHEIVRQLKNAGRVSLANGNEPSEKVLPESDLADMGHFIEMVKMMLPGLGFNMLQPRIDGNKEDIVQLARRATFVMTDVGTDAKAKEIDGEFVVLKGSTARKKGTKGWDSYVLLRDKLVSDGKLSVIKNGFYEFTENVAFSSPSAAAAVVAARNTNGRMSWRLANGAMTYGEWKSAAIEAARKNE
ncbi:GIY-YIG nuclease family protein [Poriferisphaera corsica]|nr:GIY-YIG nuclease family protein [Poriferisphaera corsica]